MSAAASDSSITSAAAAARRAVEVLIFATTEQETRGRVGSSRWEWDWMVALLLVSMEAWYRSRFIEEVETGSGGARFPPSFCFLFLTKTAGPMGYFSPISMGFFSWDGGVSRRGGARGKISLMHLQACNL
jgi:hypothetical protein